MTSRTSTRADRAGFHPEAMLLPAVLLLARIWLVPDTGARIMPAHAPFQEEGTGQDPNEAESIFETGKLAYAQGELDEAIEAFSRCLDLAPDRSDAAYNIACCLALKGDTVRSLQWLDDAVARGFGGGFQKLGDRVVPDVEQLLNDPDLARVRASAAFVDVLDRAELRSCLDMDCMVDTACRRLGAGRPDLAIAWLERAAGTGWGMVEADLDFLRHDPRLELVRSTERFQRVLQVAVHRRQRTVEALDSSTGRIDWIDGPRDKLVTAAFNPDGMSFLVGGFDGAVRVYDATGGTALRVLRGHRLAVMGASYSPDGEYLVTAGVDTIAQIWDRAGDLLATVRAGSVLQDVSFSPDGKHIVTAGMQDHRARVWEAATGKPVVAFDRAAHPVWSVAFSPDGGRVAVGDQGGNIAVFEVSSGDRLAHFAPTNGANVRSLAFDGSGTGLLAASWDGAVRVVDASTGSVRHELRSPGRNWLSAAFSPDGALVAGAADTGECVVWELATGKELRVLLGHAGPVAKAAFSPDCRRVLTCGYDACARVWDLDTGSSRVEVSGRPALRSTATFSPDGQHLAVIGESGVFDLDLRTGLPSTPSSHPEIAMVGREEDAIAWRSGSYDWSGRSPRMQLPAEPGVGAQVFANPVAGVAFVSETPERGWLALNGADEAIPIESGVAPVDRGNWELVDPLLSRARLALDGSKLVTLLHGDGRARVWDTRNGRLLRAYGSHADLVTCAAFHPGGNRIATGSLNGSARIWDLSDGRTHAVLVIPGAWFSALAFSLDGNQLVSGDMEGNLRLWDANSGHLMNELGSQRGPVTWLEFAAGGTRLCSAGADESVQVWDVEEQRRVCTFATYGPGQWLSFVPDLYYAASPGMDRRATLALRSTHYSLSCFAAPLKREDLLAQYLAGQHVEQARLTQPPMVDVVEPTDIPVAFVQDREVKVRLRASDESYGIKRVVVEQDGAVWPEARTSTLRSIGPRDERMELEVLVRIPDGVDRTVLGVQAVNSREIASRELRLELVYEAPKENLYLLAIGVQDYDDDVLDLSSPRKDAKDIIEFFGHQEGLSYHRVRARSLLDAEVTVEAVRELANTFLDNATERDTIIAFVAGHGIVTDRNDFYLLTSKATPRSPFRGVREDDLMDLISSSNLRPQRRLLWIDTCFSAAVGTRGESLQWIAQGRVDELVTGRGVYVIAASGEREPASESDENGVFTRALLEGLRGQADFNQNDLVEIRELLRFVEDRVAALTEGRQRPTTPKIEVGEDFPIARVPTGGR